MNSAHSPLIHVIRRFNRFYTNILGLLDQHLLDSEFSLSEARVLYEIGNTENSTAKKLIEELKIDPGYLSRIIKRFERQSLIYREKSAEDGRLYYLYLTDQGKATLSKLNELSDRQIRQIVGELSEQEQTHIVESMEIIANTLSWKSGLIDAKVNIRYELKSGDVGYLIHLHGWIYAKECGYNHAFEGYVCKTFHDFFERYSSEKDRFWFAEVNGKMIGAIAIVGHSAQKAQLRWFILHPEFRGMGLGRTLLNEALQFCKEKGYQHVFLETTKDQKTAIQMYLKAGFRKTAEHGSNAWGKNLIEQAYELDLSKREMLNK